MNFMKPASERMVELRLLTICGRFLRFQFLIITASLFLVATNVANSDEAPTELHLYRGVTISIPGTLMYEARMSDGTLVKSGFSEGIPQPDPMLEVDPGLTRLLMAQFSGSEGDFVYLRLSFYPRESEVEEMRKIIERGNMEELAAYYDYRAARCCHSHFLERISIHGDSLVGGYPRIDYRFREQEERHGKLDPPTVSRWVTIYRDDGEFSIRANYPDSQRNKWDSEIESVVQSLQFGH